MIPLNGFLSDRFSMLIRISFGAKRLKAGGLILLLIAFTGSALADMFVLTNRIQVDALGPAGASDGKIVAASDNRGATSLYRVDNGELMLRVNHAEYDVSKAGGETNAIDFSPDGKWFLTGMNDTGCKIWDARSGKLVMQLGNGTSTDGAAFSPDGRFVAVAQNKLAVIYSLPDFKVVAEIDHTEGECNMIDWAFDSSLFASCAGGGTVKVTRSKDWKVIHEITFPARRVKGIRLSPDGRYVAACGGEQRVLVYRLSDGKVAADLPHPSIVGALEGDDNDGPPSRANVEAVVWTNDSRHLITGGTYDGRLRVWRVGDWTIVDEFQGQALNRQVEYLRISVDGVLASVGDEGYLYLFDSL